MQVLPGESEQQRAEVAESIFELELKQYRSLDSADEALDALKVRCNGENGWPDAAKHDLLFAVAPAVRESDGAAAARAAKEDELKDMDKKVKAIVTAAAEFSQQSPEPDPSELYTDILVDA